MTSANRKRAGWNTALLIGSVILGASADQSLRYGPRANRHEGIRAKKVAGFGVELLFALVQHPFRYRTPKSDRLLDQRLAP